VIAGDQVFICGINGSGKTRLAMRLANALDRVLIYEPKGGDTEVIAMPNAARCWGVDAALAKLPGRVIYHPTGAEMSDLPGAFDRLVAKILASGGHHGIVVMETCDVGTAAKGFAPSLSLACRQGGSHSGGYAITRIFCSQRPVADVPKLAKSEAKHFVAFFLVDDEDRRQIAAYMGPGVIDQTEFGHDYWYSGRESGFRAVRCAAL